MIQKLTQTTLKQLRFAPKLHMHQFVKAPLPFVRNNIFLFSQSPKQPFDPDRKVSKQEFYKQKQKQMMEQGLEEDPSTYDKSSNNMGMYMMIMSIAAICIAYGMMEIQTLRTQKRVDKSISGLTKVQSTGKAHIGGDWELIDTKGKIMKSQQLLGTYYLIYFGFTNCPDICPNSLIKLSRAIEKVKKMPEAQYIKLKTIFVSVDPDRDTPQKIEKFLSYFSKEFIGVTGKSNDDPDLRECMKKFKIYASKIEFEDTEAVEKGRKSYTIDHTILTYLMSDSNEYVVHLGGNLGEHELAKTIIEKILQSEHEKMKMMKV